MPLGSGDTWDESNPQQSSLANTLDSYDRDIRIGVRGRMALEHEWPASQSVTSAAGYHKFVTLQNQAVKPTISGTQLAALYTKTAGTGFQELFWENELGGEVQLTSRTFISGSIVQIVNYQNNTMSTGAATIPFDDTIPQINEGTEFMTLSITPSSATNKLKIDIVFNGQCATDALIVGLFQDATVNALDAVVNNLYALSTSGPCVTTFSYTMTAGTTSLTTFRVRAGGNSGTTTFNGTSSARKLGGATYSSITITEIKV